VIPHDRNRPDLTHSGVRIGCFSGFWGDSSIAAPQLVHRGRLDYLIGDYLAEITLSIMARQRQRDSESGYATDFVEHVMPPLLAEIKAQKIRIVCNAGGINPQACCRAVRSVAKQQGVSLRIAVVLGDDLERQWESVRRSALAAQPDRSCIPEHPLSVNAYLGAIPIARALDAGAEIVITGRCADSALALGPLLHEFAWAMDDYDRLAAGSLVGHVLECGAQACGGLFTDWREVPDWENIGYPIASCRPDGSFELEKPPRTGGLITTASVAEQIVYEIGDPARYILPDVVCDFRQVRVDLLGKNRVCVQGARGLPPTTKYKVSATFVDGYRCMVVVLLAGIEAAAKARRVAQALLGRSRALLHGAGFADFSATHVEVIGAEESYGPHCRDIDSRDVVLKIGLRHPDKAALELFSREVASAGTSMAPGLSGLFAGRPKSVPVVALYSCLLDKGTVPVQVCLDGESIDIAIPTGKPDLPPSEPQAEPGDLPAYNDAPSVPLIRIAHGRSGDKGNDANIGIIARHGRFVPVLERQLSAAAVQKYLQHLVHGPVQRFALPGLHAFNFLLHDALGGGGTSSLRYDAQGKALAQLLLDFPVRVPRGLLAEEKHATHQ